MFLYISVILQVNVCITVHEQDPQMYEVSIFLFRVRQIVAFWSNLGATNNILHVFFPFRVYPWESVPKTDSSGDT